MWGDSGKFYWGRKEERKVEGIVVIFAWMSSQEKHLRNYVDLYASLGWNSLICHSEFLNLFFPDRATSLALGVVNELIKELKVKPAPIVLAAFSGGPKSCMYKVLQIVDGTCEVPLNLDECQLVRDCISGQIYDSSPVDFTSDLGTRFVLHPSVLRVSHPPRFVAWVANRIASGLDTVFLNRFESQRAEYWQTLYSTVNMGGPYLILFSEDDDLAPYQTISNFAQRLQELGGDVKIVKWNNSSHVGHYKHYPADYKAAVTELLGKSALVYSRKIQKLQEYAEGMARDEISESICNLRKAAMCSSRSLLKVAVEPSDHFFLPGLNESHEGKEVGSTSDERKEELFHLQNPPAINAHGIIGQILFDVCIPKNIEGWDIKPASSMSGRQSFGYGGLRRNRPFNPIKCIRRSRL